MNPDMERELPGQMSRVLDGADASALSWPDDKDVYAWRLIRWEADVPLEEQERKSLEDEGILENLRSGVEKLNTIISRVEQGEGTIGKLLMEDQVYDDIAAITRDLRDVSDKIARGESTLGKFMADEGQLYDRVDAVVGNLADATQHIAKFEGTLGKLLSDDDTMYEDIKATAESIREISASLERGEGTLGKLIEDEGLYTEMRLLINEARATLDDFRETAPISTFVSIFLGYF